MMDQKMMEYEEIIKEQLCKEIEIIAESIKKNGTMSVQEMDRLDKIYHTKKSMLTADAMEEASDYTDGYDNQNGMSERRGRSMTTGRYVSRTAGGTSYADGYNEGYSEAMRQMGGNSEHYPMMPQNYGPRRW